MFKRILFLFVISIIFLVMHCTLLYLVHSNATPLISIVFISIVAWRSGAIAGLLLTILNFTWIGVSFRLLAPEFGGTLTAEAIIALCVSIGISFLLGYFGRLAKNLRNEIEVRKKAEASLQQLRNELEERVEIRTRELERVNDRLRQAEKMETIGQLVGCIAHDFNNMLSVIIGYSALLITKLDKNMPEYGYAQNIEKTAQAAAEQTSLLLKFARKKKYNIQSINLNDLIKDIIPLLRIAVQRGITITHIAQPDLPLFSGGPDQIRSAILNLSLNARDAMEYSGSLTITTKTVDVNPEYCNAYHISCASGTYAGISVTDTGTGIEPDVFKHLFEPFFTTKEEGKGTGMGLAAVYGVAQNHKGAVFAETQPGRGTTFTMLFPVNSHDCPAAD